MDKMELLKDNFGEFAKRTLEGINIDEGDELENIEKGLVVESSLLCSLIESQSKNKDVTRKAIEELLVTCKHMFAVVLIRQMLSPKETQDEKLN